MKTKIVLWGTDANEERVLIALELLPSENFVNLYTFPDAIVTEEFNQKMLDEWRDGKELEFPEGYTVIKRELNASDSLLPDDLKAERTDVVQRAHSEWHFLVLSSKLNDAYASEISGLKDRISALERYDSGVWNNLKTFWDKVQVQVRDRNLLREHANDLRDKTNELFASLKQLRAKMDEEFKQASKSNQERFEQILKAIEGKVNEGKRLQPIFDELKDIQRKFRDTKFTKEHRAKVWEQLDGMFKLVKEKRFGSSANQDRSPSERLQRRYEGLIAAIGKMERSIERDHDDLSFQNRKIANTDGQLEAQIRQAKIKMIEERIRSKVEKLKEMHVTKTDLEGRIEKQKEKDARREAREKEEQLKKEAEARIAKELKEASKIAPEDVEKLEKAAESINEQQGTTEKKTKSDDTVVDEQASETEEKVEVEEKPKEPTEEEVVETPEAPQEEPQETTEEKEEIIAEATEEESSDAVADEEATNQEEEVAESVEESIDETQKEEEE
ncbi:MAG: hypothetical protein AAFO07_10760 [Bacteroidota bacterium]